MRTCNVFLVALRWAHALAEEPLSPEELTLGKTPVPGVGTLERSVYDIGRRAETTDRVDARVQLYGEAMAMCAERHQWLGGGPRAEMKQ